MVIKSLALSAIFFPFRSVIFLSSCSWKRLECHHFSVRTLWIWMSLCVGRDYFDPMKCPEISFWCSIECFHSVSQTHSKTVLLTCHSCNRKGSGFENVCLQSRPLESVYVSRGGRRNHSSHMCYRPGWNWEWGRNHITVSGMRSLLQ